MCSGQYQFQQPERLLSRLQTEVWGVEHKGDFSVFNPKENADKTLQFEAQTGGLLDNPVFLPAGCGGLALIICVLMFLLLRHSRSVLHKV